LAFWSKKPEKTSGKERIPPMTGVRIKPLDLRDILPHT